MNICTINRRILEFMNKSVAITHWKRSIGQSVYSSENLANLQIVIWLHSNSFNAVKRKRKKRLAAINNRDNINQRSPGRLSG